MSELLSTKQFRFSLLVSHLLQKAHEMGYDVSLGEAYRSPQEAARLALAGLGIRNSLHTKRLAIDINLFKDGVYLTNGDDYQPLGEWWEQQAPDARWGGRFKDGNHFSLEHEGVK